MRTICIAPSGGGWDRGVAANGIHEAALTLAVGLGLQTALKAAGVPVVMTRTTDAPAGGATNAAAILQNEVATSNNANADLFLKITANANRPGACATVGKDSAVAALAQQLVQAQGVGGVGDPAITIGDTYDIQHTKAPAIIFHVGDLTNSKDAEALWTDREAIGAWLSVPLIAWAKGTDTPVNAPATTPATVPATTTTLPDAVPTTLDYAVHYVPSAAPETTAEATIQKWAQLLGVPEWIALSIAIVESGLDPNAKGDVTNGQPTSFGLFQLHVPDGQGAGYTEAQLLNEDLNCHVGISHMVQAFKDAEAQKLDGYPMLRYVACHSGHPDETGFMPESYDAALKAAYQQVTGEPADGPLPSTNVDGVSPAVEMAIERVVQMGVMTRDSEGSFRPDATIHRWELAVVLDRLVQHLKG